MANEKAQIRRGVLHNRRLLVSEVFSKRNMEVTMAASELISQKGAHCVHSFLPITRNKEVNTWPLIALLSRAKTEVVVSATDFARQTMSHFVYTRDLLFEDDPFGIPTPIGGTPAHLDKIELVLIPLLAADKQGNRIGYGKGYYDRLLTEMAPDVLKVGLTLGPLFDRFDFAEAHDIRLDYCITPQQTLKCHE